MFVLTWQDRTSRRRPEPVRFLANTFRMARSAVPLVRLTTMPAALTGCSVLSRGFLSAAGPVAAQERHEFLIVGLVMLFVIGPVMLLTPLMAWHYRLSNTKDAFRPQWGFSWILEGLIWIPPSAIVVFLAVMLWQNTERLDPYKPLSSTPEPSIEVEAVSLDWKWLFIYPSLHIATVNQLVLPTGRNIRFKLTSGTVMQSLLIPQIAGQIYAMAGMTTQLNLIVARPGNYLGENTQFNGDGFQDQKFQVVGLPEAAFQHWVATTQSNPSVLNDSTYQTLSKKSVLPHSISYGNVAPGLFATILRQTTGADQKGSQRHA
jgi:cytochrome o ubiquinol oxidase subunit II